MTHKYVEAMVGRDFKTFVLMSKITSQKRVLCDVIPHGKTWIGYLIL